MSRYYADEVELASRNGGEVVRQIVSQIAQELGKNYILFVRPRTLQDDTPDEPGVVFLGVQILQTELAKDIRKELNNHEQQGSRGFQIRIGEVEDRDPIEASIVTFSVTMYKVFDVKYWSYGSALSDYAFSLAVETPEGIVLSEIVKREPLFNSPALNRRLAALEVA